MSRSATDWAWKMKLKSSHKLLLLSLADRADETHCCYPSSKRVESDTGLNRKTISEAIQTLIFQGLISDTGERKGATKKVRVLRLSVGQFEGVEFNEPKIGAIYNDPENGTLNDPENGTLNDPENGTQNQSVEPVIESTPNIPLRGLAGEIREDEIISTWNEVAKHRNFKGTRGIPSKVKRYLKVNYATYLKQCKREDKPIDETKTLTDFTCAYLKDGFTQWAGPHYSGQNDRQWRADLEFATRTTTFEKVFFDAE